MTAAPWDYKLSMFEEKNVFRITWAELNGLNISQEESMGFDMKITKMQLINYIGI